MFWNGSTAIDGLSGSASGASAARRGRRWRRRGDDAACQSAASHFTPNACTGRSMFFSARLAEILEGRPSAGLRRPRARCARSRCRRPALRLQPCRDVHAIAVEIVALDDQVAEMQADPERRWPCPPAGPDWPRPWPAGTRWRRSALRRRWGTRPARRRRSASPAGRHGGRASARGARCDGPSAARACRPRPGPSGASSPRHPPQGSPPVAVPSARQSRDRPLPPSPAGLR